MQLPSYSIKSANGIGDALLALQIVASLDVHQCLAMANNNCNTSKISFIAPLFNHKWLLPFDGYHELLEEGSGIDLNAHYGTELNKTTRIPRWKRYCNNASVELPVRPLLREPDKIGELGKDFKDCVIIAPYSHYEVRSWSIYQALDLEAKLLKSGRKVVILHHEFPAIAAFKTPFRFFNKSAEFIMGLMLNCDRVVACDNGMAHLASILCEKPPLVITGPTSCKDIFYLPVKEMKADLFCTGCYFGPPSSKLCNNLCTAMASVSSKEVYDFLIHGGVEEQ